MPQQFSEELDAFHDAKFCCEQDTKVRWVYGQSGSGYIWCPSCENSPADRNDKEEIAWHEDRESALKRVRGHSNRRHVVETESDCCPACGRSDEYGQRAIEDS